MYGLLVVKSEKRKRGLDATAKRKKSGSNSGIDEARDDESGFCVGFEDWFIDDNDWDAFKKLWGLNSFGSNAGADELFESNEGELTDREGDLKISFV